MRIQERWKEIHEILEKVQEVHDTDKSYKDVGLTEYEWNRYNRGSEKYPRHANYVDRRNLAAYYVENLKYHPIGRMLPIRNLVNSMGISFYPTPVPTIVRGPPQEWSMESKSSINPDDHRP